MSGEMGKALPKDTTRYKVKLKHDLPAALDVRAWLYMVRQRPMGSAVGALDIYENELVAVVYINGQVIAQPVELIGQAFLSQFIPAMQATLMDWRKRFEVGEFSGVLEKHRRQRARAEAAEMATAAPGWAF